MAIPSRLFTFHSVEKYPIHEGKIAGWIYFWTSLRNMSKKLITSICLPFQLFLDLSYKAYNIDD